MRKHILKSVIVLILIAVLMNVIGCGSPSPSRVVRDLHTAIEKGNNKAIERLMTDQAASMVVLMGEKMQESIADLGRITNTEEEIDGNTATVTVTYASGQIAEFDLVKENGRWKVAFDK